MKNIVRRIRAESLIINAKVLGGIFLLWYLSSDSCCCKIAKADFGKYLCRDGLLAFIGIAFTANTSIAIGWVTKHLSNWLDEYIRQKCKEYYDDKKKDILESYVTETYVMELHFKRRLADIMEIPNRVYSTLGFSAAVYIAYLLYSGIPSWLSDYIILFPSPAIAYYGVALLAYLSIRVQINGDFCDKYKDDDDKDMIARNQLFNNIRNNAAQSASSPLSTPPLQP